MKKFLVFLFVISFIFPTGSVYSAAHAIIPPTYTITQLTDNSYNDYNHQINNNGHVVWRGGGYGSDYEIFLYDGTTITQLTDNSYNDYNPQINDNGHVVWHGSDGSDSEIFLYDGTTITQLTDNSYYDNNPQINDNGHVVWYGFGSDGSDSEIFLYDGTTITQLTNNSYNDFNPQINDNGHVVWYGFGSDGSDSEIFLYDGTTIIQLTHKPYGDNSPQINNNGHVVWRGSDGSDHPLYSEIFLYDGTTIIQLTDNSYRDYNPQINDNGHVVWRGSDGSGSEIFLYDGTTITQLTDTSYYDNDAQINDNGHVVWYGSDGSGSEIFLYDGTTITQLTDTSYYSNDDPQINNNGHVVWRGSDGSDFEIYLAKPDSQTSPTNQILSPVFGPIGVVNTIEGSENLYGDGKWCFNQHKTGFHHPSGGVGGSDDTYAWDINLNSPVWDSDKNKPVYAIADGVVEENYAGAVNAGGSAGQLLIRHDANGLTWWSGYLHLSNILVNPGDTVTKDDILGQIGSTGTDNNHLHFVVYAGENVSGGLISFDAGITANGTMLEFAVNDFASLFSYSWEDYLIGLLTGKESISGIVQNCLNDPDYTSDVVKTEDFNSFIRLYSQYYSQYQKPLRYIWYNDDLTTDIDTIITPFFDATWGDDLNSDSKFNTVYAPTSIGDNFEVISRIDDGKTPFDGTENESCYFFTYDSLNDGTASIENIDRWVDYLEDIVENYDRSIDTLTIFAHGEPGKINMSDSFAVVSDPTLLHDPPTQEDLNDVQNIEEQLRRLRDKTDSEQDFLSDHATILLFVCNAGQDDTGKSFIKNLANWTGAIVYANTEASGNIQKDGNRITQDWDLDVIGIPDDFFDSPDTNQYTLSIKNTEKKTVMLPNGVSIEIEEGDLAEDGTLTVKNVSDQYSNEADVICAYDISLSSQIAEGNDISVTIPFNSDPANITESGFTVKFWDATSEEWSDEGIWDILINEDYVIFKTNHTTVFAVIKEAQTVPGDFNGDSVVDRTDLNIILSYRNQPASICPECDLDGDGMITALDARKLVLLCTCPRCVCP